MEEKKNKKIYNKTWFWLIVGFFVLFTITSIIPAVQDLNKSKLEYKLIKENKITYANQVVEEVAESIKNNEFEKIEKHLATECKFYNNDKGQIYSLKSCLEDLEEYETYRIEKRVNSVEDEETYRIYWNGWNYEDTNQIIELYMKRKVNKEDITYEIQMVRLTNNTTSY